MYAVITKLPNWARGDRKEFVLGSVKATSQTKISVLGQNDKVTEYQNQLDVSSRYEQKEDGLHISVVRAQRIYDNNKWPNPITVKLENVEPALDPPLVETLTAKLSDGTCKLNARLVKKSATDKVKIGFEYRPYGGFAGNLYSTTWTQTKEIETNKEGNYSVSVSNLETGKIYEFRAVVIHPKLKVKGDTKQIKVE